MTIKSLTLSRTHVAYVTINPNSIMCSLRTSGATKTSRARFKITYYITSTFNECTENEITNLLTIVQRKKILHWELQ